jgi:adenylate cyclase class 2
MRVNRRLTGRLLIPNYSLIQCSIEELEVKILDIRREAVETRLREAGAKLVFDGEIDALFFDFPNGSIAAARDLLRLRCEAAESGSRARLTFKGYLPGTAVKARQEFETEVGDFQTTRKILESLGLVPVRTVTKHRTTYELPGVRFALDRHTGELAHIPEFLEIEVDNRETLEGHARLLGFAPADFRAWGLPELIAHYGGR